MNKEPIAKFKRIQQLKEMGLNIPRMEYFPANSMVDLYSLRRIIKEAENNGQNFVNIRTYKRQEGTETFLNKHHTYITTITASYFLLDCVCNGYESMIDIENPDNGIYSGSVMINNTPDDDFIIDFCYKPFGGAMVRMVNQSFQGKKQQLVQLPLPLRAIIRTVYAKFDLPYRSVVVEFSHLSKPAGVFNQPCIFWEYRNLTL